ncbi:unnamed protein product [Cercospora beticola]|nr:unnamed protein product [Cercospora beticola]
MSARGTPEEECESPQGGPPAWNCRFAILFPASLLPIGLTTDLTTFSAATATLEPWSLVGKDVSIATALETIAPGSPRKMGVLRRMVRDRSGEKELASRLYQLLYSSQIC